MVSLAKRLEGKPFHLVASHCQIISNQEKVIAYLKANRMSAFSPNMTITKDGSHPDVQGIRLKPYYIIFDHTGKLHAHHMCGSYHGGDEWRMIEIVDELLAKTPAIYLGAEPFQKLAPLAAQVSKGKNLGGVMKTVAARRAAGPDAESGAELMRLQHALTRYRDRKLTNVLRLEGSQPAQVVPELRRLAIAFKGSALAKPVQEKVDELSKSAALKTQIAMEKKFRSVVRKYDKTKEKKRTEAFGGTLAKKLDKLLKGNEELPFAATIQTFLAEIR